MTVSTSVAGTAALRLTRRLSRPDAMRLAAVVTIVWCALGAGAVIVPTGAVTAYLVVVAVMVAIAGLVLGGRANALAEAAAPRATRGRHLAAFQYAFTIAGVIAPALTACYACDGPTDPIFRSQLVALLRDDVLPQARSE